LRPAVPILPLPIAMIQPTFRTPLMATVGAAPLPESRFPAAGETAIALSTITVLTDPEHRATLVAAANPLTENYFAMNLHARPQTGLDNGRRSWQVRSSFDAW
jgi:hypothetical protein